eukprot:m.440942 g.440942  ORF g.440942 m.440942 type:complete len:361 (-) comp20280_c0_seq24:1769-2851(-)
MRGVQHGYARLRSLRHYSAQGRHFPQRNVMHCADVHVLLRVSIQRLFKRKLGLVVLALDVQVYRRWHVRHHKRNHISHQKHNVLKHNNKRKARHHDFKVKASLFSLGIAEPPVVAVNFVVVGAGTGQNRTSWKGRVNVASKRAKSNGVHLLGNKRRRKANHKPIGDDSQNTDTADDWKPHTNALGALSKRPLEIAQQFLSVQTNLNDVVQQCKEWCQRKRSNEKRHEPVLQNHFKVFPKQSKFWVVDEVALRLPRCQKLSAPNGVVVRLAECCPAQEFGQQEFLAIINDLLADHDDCQLNGEFKEAPVLRAFVLSVTKKLVVVARHTRKLTLEKGNVNHGRIVVDKLEEKDLDRQMVVVV